MALDLLVEQHKINIREEAVAGSKRKTKFVELVIDSPYSAYSFQRE